MITTLGWDIGGANVKAAWVARQAGQTRAVRVISRPFEIWRAKENLPALLHSIVREGGPALPDQMAVTMTAELADVFATKSEGVLFVFDSLRRAFPDLPIFALNLHGDFIPLREAQERPLDYAATNWLATARAIALDHPNCILIDTGSTTTDIIPILNGQIAAQGRNDIERLMAGELVYTGCLRTNLAAIVHAVPVRGRDCPVSSEYFAISGDIHLILGSIHSSDYTCPTPDGRPPNLSSARQRVARLVCADSEMLRAGEIDQIARYVAEQQLRQIIRGLHQVLARLPLESRPPVITTGCGAFLAAQAGKRMGLAALDPGARWLAAASAAPSFAAAELCARQMEAGSC